MAWGTHTFAVGDPLTAAQMNQHEDNFAVLLPYTAPNQVGISTSATALVARQVAWDPDAAPASPSALDDQFNTGALDGKWTEYDPDNKSTWTVGDGGAKATILTTATLTWNGIYQTLPAGDFSVWAKVASYGMDVVDYTLIGINLWENPAGDNKHFCWVYVRDNTANFVGRLAAQEWTNRSTIGTVKISVFNPGNFDSVYLRLRRTGTNYYCDFSKNGAGWRSGNLNDTAITLSFTPTKIGIGVCNYNTTVSTVQMCQFYRYTDSNVTLAGISGGNWA